MKRNEIIDAIAKRCIEELKNLDGYTYEVDDCTKTISNNSPFELPNGCYVDNAYYYQSGTYRAFNDEYTEIILNPANDKHNLENLTDAVQKRVDELLDTDELRESIEERAQEDSNYDEWNEHGFRDASDYFHYRYS